MAREQLEMSSLEERAEEKKQGTMSDSQKAKDGKSAGGSKNSEISLFKLFKYADSTDLWLMVLGTVGTVADGVATPGTMLIMSSLINTIGSGPSRNFTEIVDKVMLVSFKTQNAIRTRILYSD